jgi:TetR/AcrR family transcriptional repressor of bet genes
MSREKAILSETTAHRSRSAARDIRRHQIIAATIESINKVGFADTTLATVAKEAGISQASLIFHFKNKDSLLVETLRHISSIYRSIWKEALAKAPDDPVTSICTLVESDFHPRICNRKNIAVWHAFWGEAKSRPTYLEICGEQDKERFETMVREVAKLLRDDSRFDDAERIAGAIDGLTDGLWLRILIDHRDFSRKEALEIMFLQLRTIFPEHAPAIGEYQRRAAPS